MVKLIKHWSKIFGLNCSTEKRLLSLEEMTFDLKLIDEEYKETALAAISGDVEEYQDGLGDLLWTTIRAMLNAGIDPEKTIEAIYKSNMSKSCTSIEDVEKSIDYYKEQGINVFYVAMDDYFIIKRKSDSKVLKSINFKKPIFK